MGAPIGTVIGAAGDWRWTLVFVALLGAAAGIGVALLLKELPLPPQITLGRRLAPLADKRIVATLATTALAMSGIFTVYTYFAVVFDRATGENAVVLGALLVLWGTCGTLSNLSAGRMIDSIGSRWVLVTMLAILAMDIALTPWAGGWIGTAAPVIAVWGACGWGVLVPQQYRLVGLAPSIAPVVLGLNTASTYVGVATAGVVGAAGIETAGAHNLGFVGAVLIGLALAVSEFAARKWPLSSGPKTAGSLQPAGSVGPT
nr:MFS transporter [Frigoriglobus tundricola]